MKQRERTIYVPVSFFPVSFSFCFVLSNVDTELAGLLGARDAVLVGCKALDELAGQLKDVNQGLWQVEDQIRECDAAGDFGPRFVELARAVYRNNDRRSELKRAINAMFAPAVVEEKSYAAYGRC